MGSFTLMMSLLVAACYGAQALKCNYCKDISEKPDCSHPEEMECSTNHTYCLSMVLHHPAYGVIRRCANSRDCLSMDKTPQHLVDAHCCTTDLCN